MVDRFVTKYYICVYDRSLIIKIKSYDRLEKIFNLYPEYINLQSIRKRWTKVIGKHNKLNIQQIEIEIVTKIKRYTISLLIRIIKWKRKLRVFLAHKNGKNEKNKIKNYQFY